MYFRLEDERYELNKLHPKFHRKLTFKYLFVYTANSFMQNFKST